MLTSISMSPFSSEFTSPNTKSIQSRPQYPNTPQQKTPLTLTASPLALQAAVCLALTPEDAVCLLPGSRSSNSPSQSSINAWSSSKAHLVTASESPRNRIDRSWLGGIRLSSTSRRAPVTSSMARRLQLPRPVTRANLSCATTTRCLGRRLLAGAEILAAVALGAATGHAGCSKSSRADKPEAPGTRDG